MLQEFKKKQILGKAVRKAQDGKGGPKMDKVKANLKAVGRGVKELAKPVTKLADKYLNLPGNLAKLGRAAEESSEEKLFPASYARNDYEKGYGSGLAEYNRKTEEMHEKAKSGAVEYDKGELREGYRKPQRGDYPGGLRGGEAAYASDLYDWQEARDISVKKFREDERKRQDKNRKNPLLNK